MKVNYKKIIIILKCCFTTLIILSTTVNAEYGKFVISNPYCIQPLLNINESRLYISCLNDNCVKEIDTQNMQILRTFTVDSPGSIIISNDNTYLYVTSEDWPTSCVIRIRLTDGVMDSININGHIDGIIVNDSQSYIWVTHSTFPIPEQPYDLIEAFRDHQGTGWITTIDTEYFTLSQMANSWILPLSIAYSESINAVFVTHQWITPYRANESGAAIGAWNASSMQWVGQVLGGSSIRNIIGFPLNLENWSGDGRFMSIPNRDIENWPFSLKIFDTSIIDDHYVYETEFELQFRDPVSNEIISTEFINKVPGHDILWAISDMGNPPDDPNRARYVIKVNTATHDYQVFEIPEATSDFGYFDVSSDGRILYLTQPLTGEIIKCCPDNLPPNCNMFIDTEITNPVVFPFDVTFNAMETIDPNGDELTFEWDFDGDGIFSEPVDDAYTGPSGKPTHTYTEDFKGDVLMRAHDPYDGECIALVEIVLYEDPY